MITIAKRGKTSHINGILDLIFFDDLFFHVTCYFPDHGDTDWQIPEQLKPLDPEINKLLPYQAIELSLYLIPVFFDLFFR